MNVTVSSSKKLSLLFQLFILPTFLKLQNCVNTKLTH